jgi:hypothetical protein
MERKIPPAHLTLEDLKTPGAMDALIEAAMAAKVWHVESVNVAPHIELERWQVMQIQNGDRHFVGWNATHREGLTSTRIVEFDLSTQRGRTKSGRVYQLRGRTGVDSDGQYVWHRWSQVNAVTAFTDISKEIQTQIDGSSPAALRSMSFGEKGHTRD